MRPFSLPISLALALASCLFSASLLAEVPLRAFSASYDLHRGSMHFATAELTLARNDNHWRWRLTTRARGVYRMFYSKQPYSETVFKLEHESIRLQQIVLSDEVKVDAEDFESADFDWNKRQMKVLRKGKHWQVALSADVYDYQTIHLLAAQMQLQQLEQVTVPFYRKGKLVDSRLVYQGDESFEFGGEKIKARVYVQTITGSRSVSRYYYDARNPLLPLLVETRKGDDSPTRLRLRKVEWRS